jgi:TolA-binding protein
MRNRDNRSTCRFPRLGAATFLTTAAAVLLAGGCAGGNRRNASGGSFASSSSTSALVGGRPLDPGYAALEQKDYNAAIAKADAFLAKTPHGPGSAEALYLKGRGLEGKNTAGVTEAQAKANLQAARTAYIQALELNPPRPLQSYIRASLGNVAYFQDDYPTAAAQCLAAADGLDDPTVKAWALYRAALSQQRLGQFAQADQTFARVQRQFPGTEPARRSQEHRGARAFYVQLATFASAAGALEAAAELHRRGVTATPAPGPQGHSILRAGPNASYPQA